MVIMRYLMKKIIMIIVIGLSKIYSYKMSLLLKSHIDFFYTLWLRNEFETIGKHSTIARPCSLQGGGQANIRIGDYTYVHSHSILGCWSVYGDQRFTPSISIGNYCSLGEYNHISACNMVAIGDGLLTGRFVYIGDNAHGGLTWEEASILPIRRALKSKGEIRIGNNVWIGDKVTILGGVTIGDNVIIGANSVVTNSVGNNCLIAGAPAKVIKKLTE